MIDFRTKELWFATGSQHLYGDQTLKTVAAHADEIAGELAHSAGIPLRVIAKPVLTSADAITELCTEANGSRDCVGIIAWMHTFSPAKMYGPSVHSTILAIRDRRVAMLCKYPFRMPVSQVC